MTYTVSSREGCTLITGSVPARQLVALTAAAGDDAVLSDDLARLAGVQFAWGSPADVGALTAKLRDERLADLATPSAGTPRDGLSDAARRWLAVRPDVYSLACTKNAARLAPTVHEVKVSRSDFMADLANPDKRGGYLKIAARLVYVAPLGIIDPAEVPDGCGLVEEVAEGRFRAAKRAKSRKVDLPPAVFMNLILKPGEFTPL